MRSHEARLVFCIALLTGAHGSSPIAPSQTNLLESAQPGSSVTPIPSDGPSRASPSPSPGPSPSLSSRLSPSPAAPPQLCSTGPEFVAVMGLLTTDKLYIDLDEPVGCSGVVVRWDYCHYVLGFRGTPSGIWPTIWRKAENDSTYSLIGINKIVIVPGIEVSSTLRCGSYTPQPWELIKVEEGEYVGFFLPDSGLFVAVSSIEIDPDKFQLEREGFGFTDFLNESELINSSSFPGRALLRAVIDPSAVLPSITTSPESATLSPTSSTTMDPNLVPAVAVPVALIAAVVSAACVVAILVLIIACLVCYGLKKRKSATGGAIVQHYSSKSTSLEYNDLYLPTNTGEVVVGGMRTRMDIRDNPAYTGFGQYLQPPSIDTQVSQTFEHTYESISSVAANRIHSLQRPDS